MNFSRHQKQHLHKQRIAWKFVIKCLFNFLIWFRNKKQQILRVVIHSTPWPLDCRLPSPPACLGCIEASFESSLWSQWSKNQKPGFPCGIWRTKKFKDDLFQSWNSPEGSSDAHQDRQGWNVRLVKDPIPGIGFRGSQKKLIDLTKRRRPKTEKSKKRQKKYAHIYMCRM